MVKNKTKKYFFISLMTLLISVFCCYGFWYLYKVQYINRKLNKLEASAERVYIIYPKSDALPLLISDPKEADVRLVYYPHLSKFPDDIFLQKELKKSIPHDPIDRVYEVSGKKAREFISLIKIEISHIDSMCGCLFSPKILVISKDKVFADLYIHAPKNNGYIYCPYIGRGLLDLSPSSHRALKNFFVKNKLPPWI